VLPYLNEVDPKKVGELIQAIAPLMKGVSARVMGERALALRGGGAAIGIALGGGGSATRAWLGWGSRE
jgi:hypothetical protein